MRLAFGTVLLGALLLISAPASAATITLDFDSFADLEELGTVSTAVGDVTFTGSTVLHAFAAGGSLFEDDFPPRSGTGVATNLVVDQSAGVATYGSVSLSFASPIYSFLGYFTYSSPLEFLFTLGNGGTATVSSQYENNLGLDFLNPTNEEIQFVSAFGIIGVTISTGLPPHPFYSEATFALDDLTLSNDFPTTAPVPEPGTLILLGTGAATAYIRRRRQDRAR